MKKLRFILLALITISTLVACGGGSGGGGGSTSSSGTNTGGGDTGSFSGIEFVSSDITPRDLVFGDDFNVIWDVDHDSPYGYTTEFHVNTTNTLYDGFSAITRVFNANCDMFGTDYGDNGNISCSIGSPISNSIVCYVSGSIAQSRFITKNDDNSFYGILKVCAWNSSMIQECDTASYLMSYDGDTGEARSKIIDVKSSINDIAVAPVIIDEYQVLPYPGGQVAVYSSETGVPEYVQMFKVDEEIKKLDRVDGKMVLINNTYKLDLDLLVITQ